MPYKSFLKLIFLCFLLNACITKNTSISETQTQFHLLDSAQAANKIVIDTTDRFFDLLQPLEMCIQMHKVAEDCATFKTLPQAQQLDIYRQYIRADVKNFTPQERQILETQMRNALEMIYALFPQITLPKHINLIKTESRYYGKSVFFTRQENIIIPAPQLQVGNEKLLRSVLIHEIFHIYSRYNPQKKHELFALLGFKRIDSLELSPFIKERVLYNPDATDYRYMIQLQVNGKNIQAVPVIYSHYKNYQSNIPFFKYILFQLFPVEEKSAETNIYVITSPNVGLDPEKIPDFKRQIGNNTNYFIHPEEVLADNFKLLVLAAGKTDAFPSPEIMQAMYAVINAPLELD